MTWYMNVDLIRLQLTDSVGGTMKILSGPELFALKRMSDHDTVPDSQRKLPIFNSKDREHA